MGSDVNLGQGSVLWSFLYYDTTQIITKNLPTDSREKLAFLYGDNTTLFGSVQMERATRPFATVKTVE